MRSGLSGCDRRGLRAPGAGRQGRLPGVFLAAAALLLGGGVAGATEIFTLTGDEVGIFNLVGPVEVVAGTGRDVIVEVTKHGPDADKLRIETGPIEGKRTLRVIYPGNKIIYGELSDRSTSTMRVNEDGTFNTRNKDSRMVTITGKGNGTEAHATLVVRLPAGRKLGVHSGVGRIDARDVAGDLRLDTGASAVTVTHLKGGLVVDVGSGDVTVDGVEGDVSVDTGSGDISLASIAGSSLIVDTGSGSVRGHDIRVGHFSGDTGSGDIEIVALAAARIGADSGSGSVELELLADAESIDIDTGSGDVRLVVPKEFGALISVEVGSGDIDITIPMAEIRKGEASVSGRIGNGEGRVTIETGSGGVVVAAK